MRIQKLTRRVGIGNRLLGKGLLSVMAIGLVNFGSLSTCSAGKSREGFGG